MFKKRILAGLMAASLITTIFPANLLAKEDTNATPVETTITKTNVSNPIGGYDADGNLMYGGDPAVLVDGDTVYLYTSERIEEGNASGEAAQPEIEPRTAETEEAAEGEEEAAVTEETAEGEGATETEETAEGEEAAETEEAAEGEEGADSEDVAQAEVMEAEGAEGTEGTEAAASGPCPAVSGDLLPQDHGKYKGKRQGRAGQPHDRRQQRSA